MLLRIFLPFIPLKTHFSLPRKEVPICRFRLPKEENTLPIGQGVDFYSIPSASVSSASSFSTPVVWIWQLIQ